MKKNKFDVCAAEARYAAKAASYARVALTEVHDELCLS